MEPRGIRNNNPGNIRSGSIPWIGQTGKDDKGFCIFSVPVFGIRAIVKLLDTYYKTYKLNTVAKIISRWAPTNENDTKAYIQSVADKIGVKPTEKITILEPQDLGTLKRLVIGIITHENGKQPYPQSQIEEAIELARRA